MPRKHLILFSAALSCIAASFPEYPVKSATEYANVVKKLGLAVAVIPMEDPQDQHKYFGMDLQSRGYVPVFLVIENQTSTDSFLLGKEGLMYSPAGRSASTLANPARSSKADKALVVAQVVPYYGFLAAVMVSKSRELRLNILKRELQSTTLSPGTSAHGFVFVPAHWQHSLRDKIELTIPFNVPKSGETVIMDLAF
jgi:hypothetical protein